MGVGVGRSPVVVAGEREADESDVIEAPPRRLLPIADRLGCEQAAAAAARAPGGAKLGR